MTAALKKFSSVAQHAQEQLDKFREDLTKDPVHALKWGNSAFQAAARLSIAQMMVYCFTDHIDYPAQSVEEVRKMLLEKVTHRSKYPPQSTSPTSNLMEQYELAALAEALDDLKYLD